MIKFEHRERLVEISKLLVEDLFYARMRKKRHSAYIPMGVASD
jgi:hypothetical protein